MTLAKPLRYLPLACLLAFVCTGCDPIFQVRVRIDVAGAPGLACAVEALGTEGVQVAPVDASHAGFSWKGMGMNLATRTDGFDAYTSEVGHPTCDKVSSRLPGLTEVADLLAKHCAGTATPRIQHDVPLEGCAGIAANAVLQ
jgi:hypothetical protein